MDIVLNSVLREQAWERAKGELQSMLCTYCTGEEENGHTRFRSMDNAINDFVKEVEHHGWHGR